MVLFFLPWTVSGPHSRAYETLRTCQEIIGWDSLGSCLKGLLLAPCQPQDESLVCLPVCAQITALGKGHMPWRLPGDWQGAPRLRASSRGPTSPPQGPQLSPRHCLAISPRTGGQRHQCLRRSYLGTLGGSEVWPQGSAEHLLWAVPGTSVPGIIYPVIVTPPPLSAFILFYLLIDFAF